LLGFVRQADAFVCHDDKRSDDAFLVSSSEVVHHARV
jgi:hypothetical protein